MKILHTADIHLGAKNTKLPLEKQIQLRNEQNLIISNLFKQAYQNDFDIIVICGDLFHSKNIQSKIISNFFDCVKNFSRPVLYIKGNHDEKFDFAEKIPSNFIILDEENPYFILNNVMFWGQVKKETILKFYSNEMKNILLLHGDIIKKNSNDYIDINYYINNFKFDYIALGHVHSYSTMNLNDSLLVYSGSLFSNGFDETGEKGYVEVNIENSIDIKFIPIKNRKYVICNCDITGLNKYSQILQKVKEELDVYNCKQEDIVRVILTGYVNDETEKYLNILEKDSSNFFYFELKDNTKLKIDFEKIKNEELSFKAEFLLLVEQNEEDINVKNKISQIGIEALRGDDILI